MERGNLSRRGFMQRSIAAGLAAGLPVWHIRALIAAEEAAKAVRKPDANGKIVMGAIGIGSPKSRGMAIMNEARKVKGVEYVAVADVTKSHRERAAKAIGPDCKTYEDFREMLDRKDINAVTIATPDHWHALVAIDALRKGKDVYCEKPLSLTVAEGRAIAKVVKETGRIFQVGSQQRTEMGGKFRLAVEVARAGRVGKIGRIEARVSNNPVSPPIPVADVPEGLNWDFWLGPTPKVDYRFAKTNKGEYTNCHYEFRWWYQFSGGKITDWGAHHNDIAQWALNMDNSGPIAIEATGEKAADRPDVYDVHPQFDITYRYANGATLLCTNKGENGVRIEGEGGKWIFVSRGKIEASDKAILEEKLPDSAILGTAINHMANFLECVRDGKKQPDCTAEIGHRSATVCHLGAIALRTGKKLTYDPVKEQLADEETNRMLSRPYRAPWKLEV